MEDVYLATEVTKLYLIKQGRQDLADQITPYIKGETETDDEDEPYNEPDGVPVWSGFNKRSIDDKLVIEAMAEGHNAIGHAAEIGRTLKYDTIDYFLNCRCSQP